ncbi:TlpA family protein disulfide reductase [Paramagnetospirillum kuznetsovii]|uniref:TlpA family protein disulfide reductase n=1 Tax=Paramagnetospirillum kuznetsovii TaxID=2053833 RepID=A0A364NVV4_9PROT|nr:TlpA disulfide reductase family protein [Paramagnetospirillum kuznetsovii]RAU21211.1 TlpA family protein disulfide reductase [Paramagnetospirillum kuznetsovii]
MSDRVLMLVAVSIILMMVVGTSLQLRKPQHASPLLVAAVAKAKVPRPLTDIASVDAAGVSQPLNARVKRPTVINFWATWCIPCVRELPTLGTFKAMADAAGIDVLTISEDKEGAAPALKMLEDKGLKALPLIVDADGSVAKATSVKGMPTTLIIDAKGMEIARMEGEVDWSQKQSLDTILELLEVDAPAR